MNPTRPDPGSGFIPGSVLTPLLGNPPSSFDRLRRSRIERAQCGPGCALHHPEIVVRHWPPSSNQSLLCSSHL